MSSCSSDPALSRVSNFSHYGEVQSDAPYKTYSTQDQLGRKVNFYVSSSSQKRLPLFLFVPGSGCESNFWKKDGQIVGGYQDVLLKEMRGRAHVMVVEKPGVTLFDETQTPGTAENCSKQFRVEHTLERWSAALDAALNAALSLPQFDASKVVAIGHSEGAIAVASLAATNSKVSEIVMLSGNGANQLFDFVVGKSPDEVEQLYRDFEFIVSHSEDSETLFWGHPAKRWASFMRISTAELLAKTKARILLVHGTKDVSIPIESFDFLVTELKRKGQAFASRRLKDADHSLNFPGESKSTGMKREFRYIAEWAGLLP